MVLSVGTLKEEDGQTGDRRHLPLLLWERYVLWLTNLPGMRSFLWQAGRFWSQDQDSIFQRQQIFSVRKVPRFWSCRLSVQYLLRIMADCMRHLRNWIHISGSFYKPCRCGDLFDEMDRKEMDVRSLGQAKIAVIGEGTKKKLKEHHLLADFVPSVYDGDTLGAELAKELQGNEKILIPRAEAGNKKLTELLEQTGAKVDDIATYTTCYEKSRLIDEKKELETGSVDCVVFTSASTVKGFVEGTKGLDYTKVKAACIGKQTKAAADAYGMQTRMAKKATIESLIELVEEMKQEN